MLAQLRQNKVLNLIAFKDWVKYLDFIISDELVAMSIHINEEKSDYIIKDKVRGSRQVARS